MSGQIILIDDNAACNHLHKRMIEIACAHDDIVSFESSVGGLSYISKVTKKDKVTLLLDINMPNLNGFETLQELQKMKLPFKLDVFILSSTSDLEEIDRCKSIYQECKFIEKPLTIEKIKLHLTQI